MDRTAELLLDILSAHFHGENADISLLSSKEAEALLSLADEQHILPIVFETIYGCRAAKESPLYGKYRQAAMREAAFEANKEAAFLPIRRALYESGLHPLDVKGQLCQSCYPMPHLRFSADSDLLLPEDEFPACGALLSSLGLTRLDKGEDSADEMLFQSGVCRIEIHRASFPEGIGALSRVNAIFEGCFDAPTEYGDGSVDCLRSLSPFAHLVYLLCHAYKHFIHSGFGIRQACDIGLWADRYRTQINMDELYELCGNAGMLLFARAVFLIAERATGRKIPLTPRWETLDCDPAPMLTDILESGAYGALDADRLHAAPVTLRAASDARGAGTASVLFPPKRVLEEHFPALKKHPVLYPVAWVKRLFGYAASVFGGRADAKESIRIAKKRLELLRRYGIIEKKKQ